MMAQRELIWIAGMCLVFMGFSEQRALREWMPTGSACIRQSGGAAVEWGFFAHRRINRLAVLTLPPEMMVFFKPHIDWLSDHAVDADMRRYAVAAEGPRHYIDLDEYGVPPFDDLPRTFLDALLQYSRIWGLSENGDTVLLYPFSKGGVDTSDLWRAYFARHILPAFSASERQLDPDTLSQMLGDLEYPKLRSAFFEEKLSTHGILPWHLQKAQRDLTAAFRRRDAKSILRLCADMGHYIGDAHVPLHTTSNYNGQKTGQIGIHALWESRIPELFADEQYDYFVGKPSYIGNTTDYFWSIVLRSHMLVDSVLNIERYLSQQFPADLQRCPELRGRVVVSVPCKDYAAAYQSALNGMIERQMRAAIHAVASAWYTAWVDAGQPNLSRLEPITASEEEQREQAQLLQLYEAGRILGRPEEH